MYWMKLDIIDREHQRLIFPAWRLVFPVASERIVFPSPWRSEETRRTIADVCLLLVFIVEVPSIRVRRTKRKQCVRLTKETWGGEMKRTYWIATLPSIEPSAYPSAPGNTAIVLVCHFRGEETVYRKRKKENSTMSQVFKTAYEREGGIRHRLCKASLDSRGQKSGYVGPRSRLRAPDSSRPSRNICP